MKKENTSIRLKRIMSDRNLRQVDILNLTEPYCKKYDVKMNKSDISQYCSGKTEPNQDKLFILGIALNVSEAWLMGFDVPMERGKFKDAPEKANLSFDNVEAFKKAYEQNKYLKGERELLDVYRKLSEENKGKTIQYSKGLLSVQNMELQVNAAHNSKGEFTEDERQEDENMLD